VANYSDYPALYMQLLLAGMGCLLGGLIIKTLSFPERLTACRGRVDLLGASHQIWHCFMNIACLLIFLSWRPYLDWRHDNPCPG
jgi:predicted membrane channel-forming protein YqfA (hemolysin III family)